MSFDPDWLVPDWAVAAHVRSVVTTRAGGVSLGPYGSLNLGRASGDDPARVDANRAILQRAIGRPLIHLSLVHGTDSVVLTRSDLSAGPGEIEADACVTREPGVVCIMRVADCLPVLLTDRAGMVVGAVHAGWRGLCAGVIESATRSLRGLQMPDGPVDSGVSDTDLELLAWLGPCIGPKAFEVGDEVRAAFLASDPACGPQFQPRGSGKWLADLPALARRRLNALGIRSIAGNDGSEAWCTVSNPSRFFSHRRDSVRLGGSGRMAACIWLDRGD